MDSCVSGYEFDSTASIPLRKIFEKALKNVRNPDKPEDYLRLVNDCNRYCYAKTYSYQICVLQENQ